MPEELQDKTRVRIYTDQFIVSGDIAMYSDSRLTDYILSAHDFIALTTVQVRNLADKPLFSADFLNIQKDKIVVIVLEAMVRPF